MVRCCVCRRAFDVYYNLSFHRFPLTDEKKKEIWCRSMGLSSRNVKKYWRICGLHFEADAFEDITLGSNKKTLKVDAVPSIVNISEEEIERGAELIIQESLAEEDVASIEFLEAPFLNDTKAEPDSDEYIDDPGAGVESTTTHAVNQEHLAYLSIKSEAASKAAEEKIATLKRKLNRERVQKSRLKKKVTHFRALMKELRVDNFLTKDGMQKGPAAISPTAEVILKRMFSKKRGKSPAALKSFATTLYSYSPKAYDYIRKSFLNSLPHASTIRKWCQSVDGSPGQRAKQNNKGISDDVIADDVLDEEHIELIADLENENPMEDEDLGNENPVEDEDFENENPMGEEDFENENAMEDEELKIQNIVGDEDLENENPMEDEDLENENPMEDEDLGDENPMEDEDVGNENPMVDEDLENENPIKDEGLGNENHAEDEDFENENLIKDEGLGNENHAEDEDFENENPTEDEDLGNENPIKNENHAEDGDFENENPAEGEDFENENPTEGEDFENENPMEDEDFGNENPTGDEDLRNENPMEDEESETNRVES